jgi:hypothetical protein
MRLGVSHFEDSFSTGSYQVLKVLADFAPQVAATNAYLGYTQGQNMYGDEMGNGGATLHGVGAILPFIKFGKVIAPLEKEIEGGTKLLNQFNSAESIIEAAGPTFTIVLKHGELQGFITGDANVIFKSITNGGTTLPSGAVKMSNGTFIKFYQSTSRGVNDLLIHTPTQNYKIRINP